MKGGTIMIIVGALIFLAGALFGIIFGATEGTLGKMISTNPSAFYGIELGVSIPLLIIGAILFIWGILKNHSDRKKRDAIIDGELPLTPSMMKDEK